MSELLDVDCSDGAIPKLRPTHVTSGISGRHRTVESQQRRLSRFLLADDFNLRIGKIGGSEVQAWANAAVSEGEDGKPLPGNHGAHSLLPPLKSALRSELRPWFEAEDDFPVVVRCTLNIAVAKNVVAIEPAGVNSDEGGPELPAFLALDVRKVVPGPARRAKTSFSSICNSGNEKMGRVRIGTVPDPVHAGLIHDGVKDSSGRIGRVLA